MIITLLFVSTLIATNFVRVDPVETNPPLPVKEGFAETSVGKGNPTSISLPPLAIDDFTEKALDKTDPESNDPPIPSKAEAKILTNDVSHNPEVTGKNEPAPVAGAKTLNKPTGAGKGPRGRAHLVSDALKKSTYHRT